MDSAVSDQLVENERPEAMDPAVLHQLVENAPRSASVSQSADVLPRMRTRSAWRAVRHRTLGRVHPEGMRDRPNDSPATD